VWSTRVLLLYYNNYQGWAGGAWASWIARFRTRGSLTARGFWVWLQSSAPACRGPYGVRKLRIGRCSAVPLRDSSYFQEPWSWESGIWSFSPGNYPAEQHAAGWPLCRAVATSFACTPGPLGAWSCAVSGSRRVMAPRSISVWIQIIIIIGIWSISDVCCRLPSQLPDAY